MSTSTASSYPPPRWLPACRVVLVLHVALAMAAWWFLPQGFPWSHWRFWANTALPVTTVLVGIVAFVQLYRGRCMLFQNVLLGLAIAWTVLPAAYVWVFPVSGPRVALPCAAVAGAMWLLCGVAFRTAFRCDWGTIAGAALAVAIGIAFPCTQMAPDPATHPAAGGIPPQFEVEPLKPRGLESLNPDLTVQPGVGSLRVRCGALSIDLQPLLNFESRSADRNWSTFGPRRDSRPPPPRTMTWAWRNPRHIVMEYEDLGRQLLTVGRGGTAGGPTIASADVFSELNVPVYSHLNTFNELTISGHQQLSLSFSPCPSVQVEALPYEYPAGLPAQLAYLDTAGTFHIVRATSGEKGPFIELGAGPLARGDPLAVTLHDQGRPVCRITIVDWAAQASTELSPTAGWGVPQNAIEFIRLGREPTSAVGLWMTLAATSVGHAQGVYRNRVVVERLEITPRE